MAFFYKMVSLKMDPTIHDYTEYKKMKDIIAEQQHIRYSVRGK